MRLNRSVVALVMIALCAALGVSGCGAPGGSGRGTTEHTITVGDMERSYRLFVPENVASPSALVVVLHGGLGSASQAERRYGWNEQASDARFVVAYPEGHQKSWNAGGGCCGKAGSEDVDDVAFILGVVDTVSSQVMIDPHRVFVTGMSNGGMMAYRLACESDLIAAIAPVAATMLASCDAPAPVSLFAIHGTADAHVPYDGSPGSGAEAVDGPSISDIDAFWRSIDECAAPTTVADGLVTSTVADCPAGRAVATTLIEGGGHEWPGAVGDDAAPIGATEAIWAFFEDHASPG